MANAAPMDLGPVFQAAGKEWNVDPNLLQAVAGQESGGTANPDLALSTAGARGRMQLMPGTAQEMGVTDTSDPVQNVFGGAKYLSQQLDKYGSPELALAAYNAGPQRVDDYLAGRGGLPAETAAYVPGIARRYQALVGSQQQSAPANDDGGASTRLDQTIAGLRSGATSTPAGGTPNDPFSTALATAQQLSAPPAAAPTAPADPFTQALQAAQAASAAPASAGPASAATSASAPPRQPGASPAPDATDPFSQAWAAAQRVSTPAATAQASSPQSGGVTVQAGDPRLAANDGSTAYRNADGTFTIYPATGGGSAPPTVPAAAPQAQTGYTVPYLGIQLPSATNLAEGAGHAVLGASRALYGAIDAGNKAVPISGQDLGGLINPQAAIANLDAENAQYQQSGVGNTPAGIVGDLSGQTVLTLPVMGGVGAVPAVRGLAGLAGGIGRGIAAGADAVSPTIGAGTRAVGSFLSGTASSDNRLINTALRPASLAANGAAQGATVSVLSGDPDSGLAQNFLTGAEAGAALGPLGNALAVGAGRVATGAKALVQPFYASGRGAIADNALARMAADGSLVPDAATYVAGSSPTLAQATGNAGLAGAERAVASVRPNPFANQAALNQDAREGLVNRLTGTPTDIDAAETARGTTAVPAITTPLANATAPADAAPVVQTIDDILASPAGQRDAVTSALGNIRSKLVTPIPFGDRVSTALDAVNGALNSGNIDPGLWAAREALVSAKNNGAQQASTLARLQGTTSSDPAAQSVLDSAISTIGTANHVESDPDQLYGIRKAIGDALSPLSARSGSDAQLASSELQQVKSALDNSIEGAAPGFKQGLADYADSSRPIDAMRYLQSKNFTSADGTVTMAKVKSVLDDISKQQALPGPRDAKSLPQATVDSLQGLYADLLRQNNSRLGMQPGSNTFQNLATSNAMAGLGAPLAMGARALSSIPVVGNALTGTLGRAYAAQNEPILDAVVNRLVNPDAGASVLKRAELLADRQNAGPAGANLLLTAPGANALMMGRQRK